MPEPRSPVMIMVEATWEDEDGTLQTARACMENRSLSGSCIRIKEPIGVGSKLKIQWRWEEFSGVTKYCRNEGKDYLIGIQKDTTTSAIPVGSVASRPPLQESVTTSAPRVAAPKIQNSPVTDSVATMPPLRDSRKRDANETFRIPQKQLTQEFEALRRKELQAIHSPKTKASSKERKPMARKWLGLGNWEDKQEEASTNSNANTGNMEAGKPAPAVAPLREKFASKDAEEDAPSLRDELMALEDIYSTAGIVTPRKGYNITKVVDMLHSEHMRGLSKEMKRNSVLMALDAAGVSTDAVLEDAKARLQAIDSYETEQRKQFEAEWARRAEENVQIQSELESIKARYMNRLRRNQDGVAREKATFGSWLTVKQQEAQNMMEAVELCLKPAAPEPPATSLPVGSVSDAITKPV
jgi:hypothetical protein